MKSVEDWVHVFEAVKNKPCHVTKSITIKGLQRTRLDTITPFLHDMLRAENLEEIYTQATELHEKLQDLGIFKAVEINLRPGVRAASHHHLNSHPPMHPPNHATGIRR